MSMLQWLDWMAEQDAITALQDKILGYLRKTNEYLFTGQIVDGIQEENTQLVEKALYKLHELGQIEKADRYELYKII